MKKSPPKVCESDIYETVINVPLYHQKVLVVLTRNIKKSRKARTHLFGKYKGKGAAGLCSSRKSNFGVFLEPPICHSTISHEIHHLVHRLMEDIGAEYEGESFAYLDGYLTNQIYMILSVNKIEAMIE